MPLVILAANVMIMPKARVLIVEDDPIIGADLSERLSDLGYEAVGPEARGEDALSYFKDGRLPDLVLMDIQLEGDLDGIATARQIRQLRAVPLIFLSSNNDEATFSQAKRVQPDAFLSKPYRSRDLQHAIELALSNFADAKNPDTLSDAPILLNDRIFIKVKERMVRIMLKDILWVEADDYYCSIATSERKYLLTQTLKKFSEATADRPELMRVHRSYIVNINAVEEIGEINLYIGQQRIPISRAKREELIKRLQLL